MADTGEGKKEEADYKRLHSFPLIRVRRGVDCVPTGVVDTKFCLCSHQPSRAGFPKQTLETLSNVFSCSFKLCLLIASLNVCKERFCMDKLQISHLSFSKMVEMTSFCCWWCSPAWIKHHKEQLPQPQRWNGQHTGCLLLSGV